MPAEHQSKQRARIPGHTPEAELAKQFNLGPRTLRSWRQRGVGPPFVKVGRQIYYSDASRDAWLKSREIQPTRKDRAA